MRAGILAAALLACCSCTVIEQPAGLIPRWTTAWKEVVTQDDRQRLADWRKTFVAAVDAAKKAGHSDEIQREGALLDVALANGLGVIPFYGLANGFLTGKYRAREDLGKSTRGERVADYLEGKGRRVLNALDEVHAETGAPLAAIALAWTNAQPGIVATLASATSLDQLQELVAAMNLELTRDQIDRLNEASAEAEPATA